jgi:hypothetical protein
MRAGVDVPTPALRPATLRQAVLAITWQSSPSNGSMTSRIAREATACCDNGETFSMPWRNSPRRSCGRSGGVESK